MNLVRRRGHSIQNQNEPTDSNFEEAVTLNNNNLKQRWKNESAVTFCPNKKALISCVISALVLSLLYFFICNVSRPSFNTASEMLRENINVANTFLFHELQIHTFLVGETFANLLKSKLRPLKERVASLKTQMKKYEKVEYNTANLASFIESSLKELEAFEYNELSRLSNEVSGNLTEEASQASDLRVIVKDLMARGYITLDTMEDPKLIDEGIYLVPTVKIDDGKFVEDLMTKYKLETIVQALEILATKLERREEAEQNINELKPKLGVENWTNINVDTVDEALLTQAVELVEAYEAHKDDVAAEISKNAVLYQLFLPLKLQLTDRIADLLETLTNDIKENRSTYLKLETLVREDIKTLKTRILNLRYKSANITHKNE